MEGEANTPMTVCLRTLEETKKNRAMARTFKRIRVGLLAKLDGTVACMDCGRPAKCYDHRDYDKPDEVEPTCRRCNGLRGRAKGMGEQVCPCFYCQEDIRSENAGSRANKRSWRERAGRRQQEVMQIGGA